jgi:DNA mismatch endonuclease, patch repair protein
MMSGIRSKDTKPEMAVRRLLHAAGFRYRLHDKRLAGTPDLVLSKYRSVVFVHGCFWHGHQGCPLFRLPKSNNDFWEKKICQNRARDERNVVQLLKDGWRILVIWECCMKGATKLPSQSLFLEIETFLISGSDKFKNIGVN